MNKSNIQFKIDTATEEQMFLHLNECKNNFNPSLNETVNILEYSRKIAEKTITFEAWIDTTLIGCVAVYFNDEKIHSGYITNVSIIKDYFGHGIASILMDMCISYAKKHSFLEIKLQVNKNSRSAIHLYRKFGFSDFEYLNDLILMKLEIGNKNDNKKRL